MCDRLSLGETVKDRAATLFASYRDDKEKVQQLERVLAACVALAVEDTAHLKDRTKAAAVADDEEEERNFPCERCKERFLNPMKLDTHECAALSEAERAKAAQERRKKQNRVRARRRKLNEFEFFDMPGAAAKKS